MDIDEMVASMIKDGWKGDPIDVVKMPDAAPTSADNTRVLAARKAGIDVKANVQNYNDPLSLDQAARFKFEGKIPATWGEGIELRAKKQSTMKGVDKEWSSRFPNGSIYDPKVTGKGK